MSLRERMENLVKIAKERNELLEGSAWWELKENLKFHTVDDAEFKLIDTMWNGAVRDDHLDKWDERFLEAVAGDYKTQAQIAHEQQIQMYKLQQQATSQLQNQLAQAKVSTKPNAYAQITQNQGLLGGLKGLLGGK